MIDHSLLFSSLPDLLHGACVTIKIGFSASLLGLVIGTCLAILEERKGFSALVFCYVNLFRGTPMLVQILFVFYILPQIGITLSPFWCATMAIGLNSGAYVSQMVRTGINAVHKGEREAGKCLGLTDAQVYRYVVLPQTFRMMIPSLGNECVTLLKDSSLASIIGVVELTKAGSIIRGRTYDAFTVLIGVTAIYLIITFFVSFVIKRCERWGRKPCSW